MKHNNNQEILPVAKSRNASGNNARACSISYGDLIPPRSSFDKPSLCKHSVSLKIFTRRSNVKIVSRLYEKNDFLNRILRFISYPSLENEVSIAAPFDVPNAKKGNEHIL
jgi:hypothetical protein